MARRQRMRAFTPKDLQQIAKDLRVNADDMDGVAQEMRNKKLGDATIDGAARPLNAISAIRLFIATARGRIAELSCLGTKH